ncbi:MAG: PEP/pyruvate-binding domain-containing protein [Micromonosporaceae bacterium]
MGDLVRSLRTIGIGDRPVAGGKGASLGELTRAGFRVPPGFVVTTHAFERALGALGSLDTRREVAGLSPDDHDAIVRVTAAVRERIASGSLPDGLGAAIEDHYRLLWDGPPGPVAVRSSATSEDGSDASFAGLQDTYLWVRGPRAVADHVRKCWASLYSVESVAYRRRLGLSEEALGMGVVVQRMVDPRCSGVMFTRSPTTGDPSVVAVEGSWGLGSAIVSGDVTPDTFVVSKVTGDIIKQTVADKLHKHSMAPGGDGVLVEDVPASLRGEPCLPDDEIHALVRLARRVEEHYGAPQDIEWAITGEPREAPPEQRIFLLQSRPETVWANRDAAPLAVPKRHAFDHVFDLLGKGFSS